MFSRDMDCLRNIRVDTLHKGNINDDDNRNSAHVECESKGDTGNNRGDWNYFKITQIKHEQHTRKGRN
jgi:hypothetical protein